MPDVIKLLPDSVANQIAAGEVIQRPASVIKELVENAVDAGATSVQIILVDAGRTLIQVIDNGQGMSPTDARLAFERHSTSKIRKADDLFSLHTMGFRGEALASIAAIAHVELRTCLKGEQLGTRLLINASQCESQEPDVCPVGSNFMIKDLFFNVPARRKFLKSNQVELSNIVKEFEKLALVNHNLDFTLTHNGNVMYQLTGGTFLQRIVALFGRNLDTQLVPLDVDTTLAHIRGFVCLPEYSKRRGAHQFLFVNGRFMRHPYFHKAIVSCYDELIPADSQPVYFLDFSVDPETIDVNIHPTKTEIKFENEVPIWQILAAAVREALGRYSGVPQIDFDTEGAPAIPSAVAPPHGGVTMPGVAVDKKYNPFKESAAAPHRPAVNTNWEELYRNFEKTRQETIHEAGSPTLPFEEAPEGVNSEPHAFPGATIPCFQLQERYLVCNHNGSLLIVDQHRAHVLVMYHDYVSQMVTRNVTSQSVLFPEMLRLTPAQDTLFVTLQPQLEKMGFSLSPLGNGDWAVNAIPAGINDVDVKELLVQVIEDYTQGGNKLADKLFEQLALAVAQRAAIKSGRVLTQQEMTDLLARLLAIPDNRYTPNGQLVYTQMNVDQIAKMF